MVKKARHLFFLSIFLQCCFSCATFGGGVEEQKIFVYFKDKCATAFDPMQYFDAKAIARRLRTGLALYDASDLPVNLFYINEVKALTPKITLVSRWFNGVVVYATPLQIAQLHKLPCVREIEFLSCPSGNILEAVKEKQLVSTQDLKLLKFQTERMQSSCFVKNKIDGSGVCIAVFDAGFKGVDKSPCFSHLIKDKHIKATYDFVRKAEDVYDYHTHGSMVLSCIAGKYDSINIGMATGATFLLARTENAVFEPFSEEENWLAAVEWADKNGADIINSSLGYSSKRYFASEMNGHKSHVSRAASMAARKGMLVVNAAGNEGSESWKYIVTPADVDSVLSVGGTDPQTDSHISFSSFGPTADNRLKPNVCALGTVIAAGESGLSHVSGTSFSAPLTSGFAACVWQMKRQLSNMEVFREIEHAGHLFPYYDYAHGFGIPQASHFFDSLRKNSGPTFDIVLEADSTVRVLVKDPFLSQGIPVILKCNLYYSIKNMNGYIQSYAVLLAEQKEVLTISPGTYKSGDTLTIHFEGYTSSMVLP
jgi:serine protease AprX